MKIESNGNLLQFFKVSEAEIIAKYSLNDVDIKQRCDKKKPKKH